MAEVPVYVLAGQSNAARPETLASLNTALTAISPPFVLLQQAVTGTSLSPSNAGRGDWNVNSTGELYDQLVDGIAAAFADILASGDTPVLGGIFWVQGEADARELPRATAYQAHLTDFINGLRGEFGPDFTFVMAEVRTTSTDYPHHEIVRQTQHDVAAALPNIVMLETEAFPLAIDGVHYDDIGRLLLGKALGRGLLPPGEQKAGSAAVDRLDGASLDDALFGLAGNDRLRGFDGDDKLDGGDCNDTLDGGAGDDLMLGGSGNDTYLVDSAGDIILEGENGGTDIVRSSASFSLSDNIERLTLVGSANIDGGGNALANTIIGNAGANNLAGKEGADKLLGQDGDDVLSGGAGKDVLTGGAGLDAFVFNVAAGTADADRIADFSHADDSIWLNNAVFTGLVDGDLAASAFTLGANATTAEHRVIYDQATGKLFFDADGVGGAVKQLFATLTGQPTDVDHTDFLII